MKQQLLQQWIKLSTKLDAMTLRERAMVFVAAVAAVLFLLYTVSMEPLLNKQKLLRLQVKQQQNQISGIDNEIAAMAQGFVVDPDAATRDKLKAVQHEIDTTSAGLMAVQKGLVAPDKIAPLLDHLLRGNGKLKLMSMKTLPVAGLNEAMQPAAAAPAAGAQPAVPANPAPQPKPRELLYRHGVEIVLQGSYLDMVNYMEALESLPVQLFWGKAKLDAQQYPNSRLTLTLYTLSLDPKWMKL
ncbi:MSHA biogenesis protein MshJ [Duganella sp. CF402]|uniref:type II secretion system protein GspM n=1 Tax=unclassified Duganella TaxID=2636909 RepID=UPI0008D756C7|nr:MULTISPECIES: type II secretion system protein GspM [unclassified Duganella]RZT10789.1 MSHA biogenesis protein MshJ [Duganella sp. BK701]SEK96463.1 MSHA biogenesis protein MshJ [Duganella sp. CF402]